MLIPSIQIIIGLIFLVWGADRFVAGAAALARNMGISPLLIGLTIVALGTSAPEIFVAITASLQGNPALAIGNALGSNIANIGLVLGLSAIVAPLTVHSKTLKREYPVLFGISLVAWILMMDGDLSRLDGSILLIGLSLFLIWMTWLGLHPKNHDPMIDEYRAEIPSAMSTGIASLWLVLGLIVLPLSSKLLVDGAVDIAKIFGLSDFVIGLTIVAVGTSLPEIATSVTAAIKGEDDIAIGNIIGSNMFNLLAVLPFPGLIAPGIVDPKLLTRDLPVMLGLTVLLFIVAYGFRGPGHIKRYEGFLLLFAYLGYLIMLIH